jgi:integrase
VDIRTAFEVQTYCRHGACNMTTISEKAVAQLPAPAKGNKLHYFSGATLQGKNAPSGFAVRVTSAGTKSFVWFHRVAGKPYLETLGRWDENAKGGNLTVLAAIIEAKKREQAIGIKGDDPRPKRTRRLEDGNKPEGETVGAMLDEFVQRYVEKEGKLRSADAIKRTFERLVKPAIGDLGVYELRRSHVVKMLDAVADERGPVMADRTLALVRKAFNWRAARDDDFHPPVAKGMARTKPKERARARILSDVDIRDLWAALDTIAEPACYPAFVRALLITATRRDEAARMRWDEIDGDIWTIPAARYKTKTDHDIPLTEKAHALIGNRPKDYAKRPFVFSTTDGKKPFSGYSKAKAALDKKIADLRVKAERDPIEPWTLHDLRRTARSLMSRAGVPTDHAERALGHVIAGVRSVYDRHEYLAEKKKAFEALETLVAQILKPVPNVTPMRRKA